MVTAEARAALSRVPLFSALEEPDRLELSRSLISRSFQEDEQLFLQGEPGLEMYLIEFGVVRICRETAGGREVTLALRREGDFIGEMALIDGQPRSASGYAQGGPCRCWLLGREPFQGFLQAHPGACRNLLVFLCARLRESADGLEELATQTVRHRLAALLVKLAAAEQPGRSESISLPASINYRLLSGLLGTVREMVSRAANELIQEGLLAKQGRKFSIPNLEALRAAGG